MDHIVKSYFTTLPPFQQEIAMTGNLALRASSKDLKQIFDAGLCILWKKLKSESSTDFKPLSSLMEKIEKQNGTLSSVNSLLFFQKLKSAIRNIGSGFISIKPLVDLPVKFSDLDLISGYNQNDIPKEIQAKADKIAALNAQLANLSNIPAAPDHYGAPDHYIDPISLEFITIPIFDASHPGFQNLLKDEAGNIKTSIEISNQRHAIEKDSLESYLATGRPWAPATCPICRHPKAGSIRRENLRIDTALQDEILAFLKNALAEAEVVSTRLYESEPKLPHSLDE